MELVRKFTGSNSKTREQHRSRSSRNQLRAHLRWPRQLRLRLPHQQVRSQGQEDNPSNRQRAYIEQFPSRVSTISPDSPPPAPHPLNLQDRAVRTISLHLRHWGHCSEGFPMGTICGTTIQRRPLWCFFPPRRFMGADSVWFGDDHQGDQDKTITGNQWDRRAATRSPRPSRVNVYLYIHLSNGAPSKIPPFVPSPQTLYRHPFPQKVLYRPAPATHISPISDFRNPRSPNPCPALSQTPASKPFTLTKSMDFISLPDRSSVWHRWQS
jgi:hypothetical protein